MRSVGPSTPRRDNETKIKDASRAPRGSQARQADRLIVEGQARRPVLSIRAHIAKLGLVARPSSRCYLESMLMVAVALRLCGRPRAAFPLPRPEPFVALPDLAGGWSALSKSHPPTESPMQRVQLSYASGILETLSSRP